MPGLEKETENLDATKRNSSQINCTMDSTFPIIPLNVPKSDIGNINTSSSVITNQDAPNKSKNYFKNYKILIIVI